MHEPIIYQVDEDTYKSGRMTEYLRLFKSRYPELRFFDVKCNWTYIKDTERYYHVLAEDAHQSESLAISRYSDDLHVGESFVRAETH